MCYVACVYLLHCNVASCRLAVVVARRTRRGLRNPFEWPRSRISSGDMLSGEKFPRQERKYRIAIRLSSSTICILVKIHQDKNRFLAFLMLSLGMTITVHHMEKSVFFLHMRFSQCLLRKEGEAMHEKLNIIIIMRWYGISERGAREERGEKMEKWKRSHFFARQQ